jgi:hypothetical protein
VARRVAAPPSRVLRGGSKRASLARKVRGELAVELFSLVNLALEKFGVTAAERRQAIKRAVKFRFAPRVSGPLLRDWWALGALLLEWSRDALYLDAEGKPRVLPIEGEGVTFEGLARRFLPDKALREVVDMACEAAEVVTRPHDRIALLGSVLVNIVGSPERSLAHTVRQVDQIVQTKLHNIAMHKRGSAEGWMERMVVGTISRAEFPELMRELRPQIYDLLLRADSSFERRQPTSLKALRSATTVSVGLYVCQDDDFERAGIDPAARVQAARRDKKP